MKQLFLLIALVAVANTLCAQAGNEKETKEVHFRIDSLYKSGDSLFAYIKGGTRVGIEKGLFGKCINLYRSKTSENYRDLATCRITAVNELWAIANIQLYSKNLQQIQFVKVILLHLMYLFQKERAVRFCSTLLPSIFFLAICTKLICTIW